MNIRNAKVSSLLTDRRFWNVIKRSRNGTDSIGLRADKQEALLGGCAVKILRRGAEQQPSFLFAFATLRDSLLRCADIVQSRLDLGMWREMESDEPRMPSGSMRDIGRAPIGPLGEIGQEFACVFAAVLGRDGRLVTREEPLIVFRMNSAALRTYTVDTFTRSLSEEPHIP